MRLLTRSDFDGLACAAILMDIGVIDSWKFVHPKDLQDGIVEVTENDVLANVPYVKGCGLWFDHHTSEGERLSQPEAKGLVQYIDSAAHVVYNYYKGAHDLSNFNEMLFAVDKVDSAKLTADEIKDPKGWILLGFIMDPRTGLGRFRDFTISNYQLMEKLIPACRTMGIGEILELPDVRERIEMYKAQNALFIEMLKRHTRTSGSVIVTDLRDVAPIYSGNRFLVYSLFPEQNVSIWVVDGKLKQNCAIAVGYSILNRTCAKDVGSILLGYGGGGHRQVGTCQVDYANTDRVIGELTAKLQ
ncbi:MAG: exopolyphosphatase [Clostridiales bacterium]|jgi:nanoRNase/pAp phosphatase (c-di-AMP/oligoRNAs hydrolase)|nr:exopolyphosphatase [Clostridiales bacterium]